MLWIPLGLNEFPMILECKVNHTHEIGLHTQFIGEIVDVMVDQAAQADDGIPEMKQVKPFIYACQLKTYHRIGEQLGAAFEIGEKQF